MRNVTLTVLEGEIIYETHLGERTGRLSKGSSISVESNQFHIIYTVSPIPSCYIYTFLNKTKEDLGKGSGVSSQPKEFKGMYSPFPIIEDFDRTVDSLMKMFTHIGNSLLYLIYNEPIIKTIRM